MNYNFSTGFIAIKFKNKGIFTSHKGYTYPIDANDEIIINVSKIVYIRWRKQTNEVLIHMDDTSEYIFRGNMNDLYASVEQKNF